MSMGVVAMLLGVFGVPLTLLWAGHRMRRRSLAWHNAFWGAVLGHLAAIVVGGVFAMVPPEAWRPTDVTRGLLALWSFLLFPVLGALGGWLWARMQRDAPTGS